MTDLLDIKTYPERYQYSGSYEDSFFTPFSARKENKGLEDSKGKLLPNQAAHSALEDFKRNLKAVFMIPIVGIGFTALNLIKAIVNIACGIINTFFGACSINKKEFVTGLSCLYEGLKKIAEAGHHAVFSLIDLINVSTRLITHTLATIAHIALTSDAPLSSPAPLVIEDKMIDECADAPLTETNSENSDFSFSDVSSEHSNASYLEKKSKYSAAPNDDDCSWLMLYANLSNADELSQESSQQATFMPM